MEEKSLQEPRDLGFRVFQALGSAIKCPRSRIGGPSRAFLRGRDQHPSQSPGSFCCRAGCEADFAQSFRFVQRETSVLSRGLRIRGTELDGGMAEGSRATKSMVPGTERYRYVLQVKTEPITEVCCRRQVLGSDI